MSKKFRNILILLVLSDLKSKPQMYSIYTDINPLVAEQQILTWQAGTGVFLAFLLKKWLKTITLFVFVYVIFIYSGSLIEINSFPRETWEQ